MTTDTPRTLIDKIWQAHVVAEGAGGRALLYIDRHLLHDGSFQAFDQLHETGRAVRRPDLCFATPDHYVPTRPAGAAPIEARLADKIDALAQNTRTHRIRHVGIADARQGIVHVVGPEQGFTLPGVTLVCGDSHTSTHGALGALAFGIGASEVAHVLATQTLWQRRPAQMRITVDGRLGAGITAKDLILAIIAKIGSAGGVGHAIEYAGTAVRALDMEGRLTLCNMSIEAGARCGIVAPDDTTFDYLHGRALAPAGAAWDAALAHWRTLPTDAGARFDREVRLDGAAVEPMVTWGTSPQDAAPIGAVVPDPDAAPDATAKAGMAQALAYTGLRPGTPLSTVKVDRVFIGSCTNSRLSDLRAAAAVVRGRRALVPAFVAPGSGLVKAAAEAEGLDQVFLAAGFEWRASGCSMCVGMNGDLGLPGERVASTSNRNFEGRQGKGVRTHLMSPAMAAAAAVTGKFTDFRTLA
ncbi:MAG: 3-isopropylmalate dehydratase large subunit [Burkholderiales bacterium]|nr:3-isopropylmalate dehydratase large subunit [Burkholderiales bacterium]